jgi:hypothetical protein
MVSLIDKIKTTAAENMGGPAHKVVPKGQQFSVEEVPDLYGKVAVITATPKGSATPARIRS